MLKNLDLTLSSLSLSTPAFRHIRNLQRERLFELEEMVFGAKLPVLILFEGWDASGKGAAIRELTRRLDPRGFKVYQTQAPRTLEKKMPWLWRFWMQIPRRGQIAIFDRSWYRRVLVERVEGLVPIPDWIRAYEEINNFERTLAADDMIFVKFWTHISEAEQLRRFIAMSNDPMEAWQITVEDWERHRMYKEYLAAVEDMLENTHTSYAPWTMVPATDQNYCLYFVYQTIINTLEKALEVDVTIWQSLKKLDAEAQKIDQEKVAKQLKRKGKKAKKKAKKEIALSKNGDQESNPEIKSNGRTNHA